MTYHLLDHINNGIENNILLIGNAVTTVDQVDQINRYKCVIRFNQPQGIFEQTGSRFSVWVICNGGAGYRFAQAKTFLNATFKTLPDAIWFPRDVSVHRQLEQKQPGRFNPLALEADFAMSVIESNQLHQPTHHLGADNYLACFRQLSEIDSHFIMPSSGFVTLHYLIHTYPNLTIDCIGFTFEGWEGHPFEAEKKQVLHWASDGKLNLL